MILLLDLDDTLLDFGEAERVAIAKTFRELGLVPTPELLHRYSELNQLQWEAYERGEISRDTVLVRRFALLFEELGLALDPQDAEDRYRGHLAVGHYFVEGAEDILRYLAPRHELYLASNGVADTQYSRLKSAGIGPYFKDIFISENTGSHKPEKAYFDYCFSHIPNFRPENTLMIGDSLTSDILGANRAGIDACWFNPKGKKNTTAFSPDYEIRTLKEALEWL